MKVVFVSNYFNHHQMQFCDIMYKLVDDFIFVATSQMREERKKLGYGNLKIPTYVNYTYKSDKELAQCQSFIDNADVVIFGSAPEYLLKKRKKEKRLIFRYSERIIKKKTGIFDYFIKLIKLNIKMRGKNQYLLCASAYAYGDFIKFGLFKGKSYKWGYFPETIKYDIDILMYQKNFTEILWCGRLIDWKHPEVVIEVGKKLKNEGYKFHITIIGSGIMEQVIDSIIKDYQLEDFVTIMGAVPPEQVREYMKKAGIYLVTSNFQEGWGAVVNEAMNSGCAVVASHAVGSVPFLLKNKENGLIYQNDNTEDLFNKVRFLLNNPLKQKEFGTRAYETVLSLWNANVAAQHFLDLVQRINKEYDFDLYLDGPCSRAEIIKNRWFKNEKNTEVSN